MYRILLAGCLVGLVAASSGCMMCASPYDYCGPVVSGGCGDCGPTCSHPLHRAGSVLPPGPGPMGPCLADVDATEVLPGEEVVVDESGMIIDAPEGELIEGEIVYEDDVLVEADTEMVVEQPAVARPSRRMVHTQPRPRYRPTRQAQYVR